MATRKKMSGTDNTPVEVEPEVVVEVEPDTEAEEIKPFTIDQEKSIKFRSDFKTWEDYNKYEGSKG